jgi:hypothetical protein
MNDLCMFGYTSVNFSVCKFESDFVKQIDIVCDTLSPIRDLSYGICAACLELD